LRNDSLNTRLAKLAPGVIEKKGGKVDFANMSDFDCPSFNQDLEINNSHPKGAEEFRRRILTNDAFIIASPEYNGSMPGLLKNAIDWASRQSDKYKTNEVFKGKMAAMITASTGSFGGLRCLGHLRGILTIMGTWVLPSEIAVSFVATKFEGDSAEMTDEKMHSVLKGQGAALVNALGS